MTSLTFYGGVNEIGGNKILLEDLDTRVLLDFGMSFNQNGKYFSEFLGPRKCNGIGDFLATGLLPDLPGIYRRDYLRHMGRPEEEKTVDAVLLSHAHMDHAAYIHHLRCDIEIHMSQGSHAIMQTIQDTGSGSFNDFLCHIPSFMIRENKRGPGYTKVTKRDGVNERPVKVFEYGRKFQVGDIEVIPFEVDHSVPGATAYLIYTSEGAILYTGDFRFHGYKTEATESMVEVASSEPIEAVITEGTRINKEKGTTEHDVLEHASQIIEEAHGLAVVNFPPRDLARFLTFHQIAQKTDRKLVIGFKQAYLLARFAELFEEYPPIDDPNICLYAERKTWGIAGRDDYPSNIEGLCFPDNICEQDYDNWEKDFLDRENTVCYEDMKDQSKYMFYCNYFQLNELIDVQPVQGSVYIRSVTEPFDEEMELDARRIENWLGLYGLTLHGMSKEDQLHASGHASGPEIMRMLEKIKPKTIYPIHTEHPKHLKKQFDQVVQVEQGVTYSLN